MVYQIWMAIIFALHGYKRLTIQVSVHWFHAVDVSTVNTSVKWHGWYLKYLFTQERWYVVCKSMSLQWVSCSVLTPMDAGGEGYTSLLHSQNEGLCGESNIDKPWDVLEKETHPHGRAVLPGWLVRAVGPDAPCLVLPAHSRLPPRGLGPVLPSWGRRVPAAGALQVSRRGFGLRLEAQMIQARFDKVKRVCCEKHLHSKL